VGGAKGKRKRELQYAHKEMAGQKILAFQEKKLSERRTGKNLVRKRWTAASWGRFLLRAEEKEGSGSTKPRFG